MSPGYQGAVADPAGDDERDPVAPREGGQVVLHAPGARAVVEGGTNVHLWSKLGVWKRLLALKQERGVLIGMCFLDGTNIRAPEGGGALRKAILRHKETTVRRLVALVAASAPKRAFSLTPLAGLSLSCRAGDWSPRGGTCSTGTDAPDLPGRTTGSGSGWQEGYVPVRHRALSQPLQVGSVMPALVATRPAT